MTRLGTKRKKKKKKKKKKIASKKRADMNKKQKTSLGTIGSKIMEGAFYEIKTHIIA